MAIGSTDVIINFHNGTAMTGGDSYNETSTGQAAGEYFSNLVDRSGVSTGVSFGNNHTTTASSNGYTTGSAGEILDFHTEGFYTNEGTSPSNPHEMYLDFSGESTQDTVTVELYADTTFGSQDNCEIQLIGSDTDSVTLVDLSSRGDGAAAATLTVAGPDVSDIVTIRIIKTAGSNFAWWSAIVVTGTTSGGDTVAPNLSLPTSASVTNTSVTLGATTDEANGIAHVIVVPDGEASTPTNQQIIDASYGNIEGTPPADLTLSATGAFTFASYTGLTGGVIYDYAIVHEDAAGNEDAGSRVEGTFTTQSATVSFDTDLDSGTVDGYLMDGATSGNPDKLVDIVAGTTNGTGILSVDLNAVAVTNSQVVEGLVEDQATGDPIPLQGTVSIS